MKALLLCLCFALSLSLPGWVYAQDEEDCVYAVDIDDEDMSDYTICGQNSGINKVLNDLIDGDGAKKSTASKVFKQQVEKVEAVAVNWLNSPAALSARRFELLQLIAQECTEGFEVKGEKYAVGPNNSLDLQFDYRCN